MTERSDLSKTLDRGLTVLNILSSAGQPMLLSEVAERTQIHRTVIHRLLRTLEAHSLVHRGENLRWSPGIGLVRLAASVRHDLTEVARPIAEGLADDVGAAVNLAVVDGDGIVALLTERPRLGIPHVSYEAGQRHALDRGAAGLAILSAGPPIEGERPEVSVARRLGYAITKAEVIPGTIGISSPVRSRGQAVASLGVSLFDDSETSRSELDRVGTKVAAAAALMTERLP